MTFKKIKKLLENDYVKIYLDELQSELKNKGVETFDTDEENYELLIKIGDKLTEDQIEDIKSLFSNNNEFTGAEARPNNIFIYRFNKLVELIR